LGQDDTPFLSRWSQRKREVAKGEDEKRSAKLGDPTVAREGVAGDEGLGQEALSQEFLDQEVSAPSLTEEEVAALPDPSTLKDGDDFKVFLRRGVPEDLRRVALRRLWSVNPVYNFRDGLNDYDLNYTDAATVVESLKTLYQVGCGMVNSEEDAAEKAAASGDRTPEPFATEAAEEEGATESAAEGGALGEAEPVPASPAVTEGAGDREAAAASALQFTAVPSDGLSAQGASRQIDDYAGRGDTRPPRPRGRAVARRWSLAPDDSGGI